MRTITFQTAQKSTNSNRVRKRKHLRDLMLAGKWLDVESQYQFRPRFRKVQNGKSVIDWTCLPWWVRDILQCGGNVKETLFTLQGGIYDPNEKPKRVAPSLIPMERRPARHVLAERIPIRFRLYESQNGRCFYCGVFVEMGSRDWTIDHKLPLSRGGTNEDSNLVGACEDCNSSKGWMTNEEFLKSECLLKKTKTP